MGLLWWVQPHRVGGFERRGNSSGVHYVQALKMVSGDLREFEQGSAEIRGFKDGYGSIPINTIFRGMNIHLPAILMFTRGIGFWPIPRSTWEKLKKNISHWLRPRLSQKRACDLWFWLKNATCRFHLYSHFCLFTRLFGDSVGLSSNIRGDRNPSWSIPNP